MSDISDSTPREGAQVMGIRLWVLMRLNRWVLTVFILGGVFAGLLIGSTLGLAPFRTLVANHNAIWWIFAAFIGAIITGVTLVVTLNQLVLSQELGAAGDQRERMQEAIDFRSEVEDTADVSVSPPEPAAFMQLLVNRSQTQAELLRNAVEADRDAELAGKVDDYVADLVENAESVSRKLDNAQFGTFDVVWASFQFNYSWKVFRARQIRSQHEDAFTGEAEDVLNGLIDSLKLFGAAREHFKTLHFQWALVDLSRVLLYISVPALVVVGVVLMNVGPDTAPGTTLGVDNLVWIASAVYTVGLAPFVVFLVYVLRIATMAKRTLAIGPFILRETEHEAEIN